MLIVVLVFFDFVCGLIWWFLGTFGFWVLVGGVVGVLGFGWIWLVVLRWIDAVGVWWCDLVADFGWFGVC